MSQDMFAACERNPDRKYTGNGARVGGEKRRSPLLAPILSAELGMAGSGRLRALVESGKLGGKSGSGFYSYKNGKSQYARIAEGLSDRLIMGMLNEAVACPREKVVADSDLADAGLAFGTGFALFRGGPMRYIHSTRAAD